MAKFKVEYDNGTMRKTLTFRGEEFTLTFGELNENGSRTSKEKDFPHQLYKKFRNDVDEYILTEIIEATETLSYESDDEIERALEILNTYE
jgi:hypothetical protein